MAHNNGCVYGTLLTQNLIIIKNLKNMENDNLKNEQQCAIHDVSGNVLTTTAKRELGKYEFFCDKCKRLHTMSAYAVAQLTKGHELIFSCPCGEKITLEPF